MASILIAFSLDAWWDEANSQETLDFQSDLEEIKSLLAREMGE